MRVARTGPIPFTSSSRVPCAANRSVTIIDAQAEGAIDPDEDPSQLAFEVEAALFLANAQYIVTRTTEPIDHARRTIDRRLAGAATTPRRRQRGPVNADG
jgi:hypothetical protein